MSIDEFWSEEPNVTREMGATYPRLNKLVEMDARLQERYFKNVGWVTFAAFHEPKMLQDIGGKKQRGIDMDKLPAMLKPTS